MTTGVLVATLWVVSGLLSFAITWDRPHESWFASWRSKAGLTLLVLTLLLMHAFLGPVSFGIRKTLEER